MTIEVRPVRPDEFRMYTYHDHVGFGAPTGDEDIERSLERTAVKPENTLCVFEDGSTGAQGAWLAGTMRWNGNDIRCGAVVDVSTLPTHRRRGLVRELMPRSFAAMEENGEPVAMLWASMAAIYQRFGYGIAYTMRTCGFDPRHLRFMDEIPTPGRLRLLKHTEALPVIRDAYTRFAAPRTLALQRLDEWWTGRVLRAWHSSPPWLVAVYEEACEVLGYAVYSVQQGDFSAPGPTQKVQVKELIWLSPAAHRALIRMLAGYDLANIVNLWCLPVDDPLFYQAQEPRLLNMVDRDGTLVRIVDVQQALEGRGYNGDGRLTFALSDDLCPWNTGTWELSAEGGAGRVKRSGADPALCLTPRALAILASGHLTATTLVHAGIIPSVDTQALRTADAIFRTAYAPFCPDGF